MFWISLFTMLFIAVASGHGAEPAWRAGVATVDVTPQDSIWMAGYASRRQPSEGVASPLYAKALAIEDQAGTRAVIVTTDLISIPAALRRQVATAVESQFGVPPAGLLLNCSHTHCGPVVRDDLEMSVMYTLTPEQRQRVEDYFAELRGKLIQVIGAAVGGLQPAQLAYSHARCGFAMNRRLPTANGFQNSPYPDGPVDHSVPVLRVESPAGELRAVAFGYACHNTTTGIMQINADYAGVAQTLLEQNHPGVAALFVMGCGGDQNPYPRGQYELAQVHGRTLATAVEAALLPQAVPLRGPLGVAYEEVALPFAPVTRAELLALRDSRDAYDQRRAEALLKDLDEQGEVRATYPYPVQVLQFGGELTMITLGGEVVIDYALRLKQELGGKQPVWVAGYSNDVMAYIPSERVLAEGGYEGGGAMRYTNLPGPWQAGVEQRIIGTAAELAERLRKAAQPQ